MTTTELEYPCPHDCNHGPNEGCTAGLSPIGRASGSLGREGDVMEDVGTFTTPMQEAARRYEADAGAYAEAKMRLAAIQSEVVTRKAKAAHSRRELLDIVDKAGGVEDKART